MVEDNSRGRPAEYDSLKHPIKVHEYLGQCQDFITPTIRQVNLPTIEGLARFMGINKSTIYDWQKKYSEFSDAIEILEIEQHQKLINQGLAGNYNPKITQLVLSTKHKYAERVEKEVRGNLTISKLNNLINAIEQDNATAGKVEGQILEDKQSIQNQRQEQESDNIPAESGTKPLCSKQVSEKHSP